MCRSASCILQPLTWKRHSLWLFRSPSAFGNDCLIPCLAIFLSISVCFVASFLSLFALWRFKPDLCQPHGFCFCVFFSVLPALKYNWGLNSRSILLSCYIKTGVLRFFVPQYPRWHLMLQKWMDSFYFITCNLCVICVCVWGGERYIPVITCEWSPFKLFFWFS